jgi:lipopolysaccharide O-acetyltransferase
MFGKITSFYRENGFYVFVALLATRPLHYLRNSFLKRKLHVRHLSVGPRAHLRGLSYISLGENFFAGDGLWLEAITRYGDESFTPKIRIGQNVSISHWSHIACTHSVTIGDDVLIGSKVIITDHNHGSFTRNTASPTLPPAQRPLERDRPVVIGSNVWLGDGAVVCPGVTIGEGSVAGANAVVTTDVPPFTLVAGVPARPIRRYDALEKRWVKI